MDPRNLLQVIGVVLEGAQNRHRTCPSSMMNAHRMMASDWAPPVACSTAAMRRLPHRWLHMELSTRQVEMQYRTTGVPGCDH